MKKSAAIAKAKSESTVNADAYKILKMLNSENFEKPNKMFRTCHAMVKNNRLFSIIRFCMALPAGWDERNECRTNFGILQHIKLLTLSVKNKPEIKHT